MTKENGILPWHTKYPECLDSSGQVIEGTKTRFGVCHVDSVERWAGSMYTNNYQLRVLGDGADAAALARAKVNWCIWRCCHCGSSGGGVAFVDDVDVSYLHYYKNCYCTILINSYASSTVHFI